MKRISNEIKTAMIQESIDTAFQEYNTRQIFPCGNFSSLEECFTIDENNIIFWYNVDTWYGMTTKITTHKMIKGTD